MTYDLQGRSYIEYIDCLGTVLLVKVGGGGLRDFRMADDLADAETQNGSGMTTGSLEAGSIGAQTLSMASNKVLPEILIPSWLFAALETRRHRLGWPQWL